MIHVVDLDTSDVVPHKHHTFNHCSKLGSTQVNVLLKTLS